jgi:hypothetical protein
MAKLKSEVSTEKILLNEISQLIEQSQQKVVLQANSTLTMLFWHVGSRINKEILQNKRADYGKRIVTTLSAQLEAHYGRNFELRNLRRMMQFAEQFTDVEIVSTLPTQLSWSHFVELLPLKSKEAKLFYAQAAATQALGIRDLRKQISNKTFERTTIANLQNTSNHPAIFNNFKDPYFLDFLGLQNTYLEVSFRPTTSCPKIESHIVLHDKKINHAQQSGSTAANVSTHRTMERKWPFSKHIL